MLLRFITVTIAALLGGQLFGQANYLNAIFDHDGRADWMNSIIQNGTGYMAVGWTANPGNVDKGIMFFDSLGNLTDWIVVYNQNFTENTQQIVRVDSNRIAKAIWFMDNSSGDRQFKLDMIDNSGNIIWEKVYGDSTINEGAQVLTYSNGRIVMTGSRTINGDQDIYIVAWDTTGNFLWDRAIGSPTNNENSYTIVPMEDGGYMVGGYRTYINQQSRWYFVKVDSIGKPEWSQVQGVTGRQNVNQILKLNDGNFLIIGYRQISYHPTPLTTRGWLIKINPYGSVLWSKIYEFGTRKSGFKGGLELSDSTLIVFGWIENDNTGKDYAWLLKVDSEGNQIWSRKLLYSEIHHNYLRDIIQTPDGGFLMVGSVLVSPNDAWVVKVDSMGCLEPGCHLGTGIPLPVSITDFAVYPNPTTGPLVLDVPPDKMKGPLEIRVYASTGQLVWQGKLPEGQMRHRFDFSGFPTGLYLAVLRSGGQIAGQSRFVKQ